MKPRENTYRTFNNYGIFYAELSKTDMLPIRNEVSELQNNFENFKHLKKNKDLAGNIKKEYSLQKSHSHLESIILNLSNDYDSIFNYYQHFDFLTKSFPLCLEASWVNFQEKYEFNPAHHHDGILSFVLYINVPYDYEEEKLVSPGYESNDVSSGMIEFLYTDSIGGVSSYKQPIDKSMENTVIIFPSKMKHLVYPFFTTDEYRISVSGNIKFKYTE
jgi:hypothetical protein